MKYLIALVIVSLPITAGADARQFNYQLEVRGMVCAFCAYNVSKQLQSVDGVIADSVNVDLNQGAVGLRSEKELDEAKLSDLILQAGFELTALNKSVAATQKPAQLLEESVFLSVTMDPGALEDGELDNILEGLGTFAVLRSGRIHVIASGEIEAAILKPLLGGRKTVIPVVYDDVLESDRTATIIVFADSAGERE